ncbi:MAG TPA: penicillin acylase family protein, partial [Tahibacter sp.]|nr:penicillin acylase family protein [Tahibacter sp.]
YPLATRFVALVVLPALAGLIWLRASLHASLPTPDSLLLTQGLSAPVRIERDAHGVPHITAASDADAYFAVGYAHAQDRLWQLELQRRIAYGRMSEVFGKASIDTDVWFRTIGLYESAKSSLAALSDPARASLKAYADGVNAWIARAPALPVEFRMLGVTPRPWTELDSLVWMKMFALDLGGNFRREISRYVASQSFSPQQLDVFFPGYPADAPTTIAPKAVAARDLAGMARLAQHQEALERDLRIGGRYVGSNAWAVSGRHTADGAALLANDPHLGLQIPSLWYAISVDAPGFKSSGMSLVGIPMVVFGHNADIAWGGTNMMADAQDLYFERPDADGLRYRVGDAWRAFDTRTETIDVHADFPAPLRQAYKPVTVQVRSTRHGPVISDEFGVFEQPVALRWTALDPDDTSYEAIYRLNFARDWDGFKAAMAPFVAPAMNLVYADRRGNIGYLGVGRLPIRAKGSGTTPSPGWNDDYAWSGYVPPAQWPQEYNPASGVVVSANNKVVGDDYPYFISHDWAPPTRARRIREMLDARIADGKPLAIDDMQRMQADTVDLAARPLLAELLKYEPANSTQARAMALLEDWDGDMRADSAAASIFHTWTLYLRKALFEDELRGYWNRAVPAQHLQALDGQVDMAQLRELLADGQSPWCDDVTTPARETCRDVLADSLRRTLWRLYKLKGDGSMRSWRWDAVQRTSYAHLAFSQVKLLSRLFDRRVGNGGSENTVNVAAGSFAGADGYLQNFGAGFRQIMSLGRDVVTHRYMNSTGQSGNVASEHYDDMVDSFNQVAYFALDDAQARAAAQVEADAKRKAALAANGAAE